MEQSLLERTLREGLEQAGLRLGICMGEIVPKGAQHIDIPNAPGLQYTCQILRSDNLISYQRFQDKERVVVYRARVLQDREEQTELFHMQIEQEAILFSVLERFAARDLIEASWLHRTPVTVFNVYRAVETLLYAAIGFRPKFL